MVKFQDLEIQHTAKYNEIKVTRKSLASACSEFQPQAD